MKTKGIIVLTFVFISLSLFFGACSSMKKYTRDGSQPAELVIANADIFTSNPDQPYAEALAVKDGRFTYVGDNKGVADFVGPDTRLIDGKGRTITPGFVDNHCHVLWIGGLFGLMANLYTDTNFEQVKATVNKFAEENPENPFIMGVGWKYDYFPNNMPTLALADSILSDRPMMLMSYGGNTGWVNTMAFNLMQERNPEAFQELHPGINEETGEYNGLLMHFHAVDPFEYFSEEEVGPEVREKMYIAMDEILNEGLKYGVTAFNDVQIYNSFVPMLLEYKEKGGLDNVRARATYYVGCDALNDEEGLKEDLHYWLDLDEKYSDSHLRFGKSTKLYIDGVITSHTSLLLEPYCDRPGYYGEAVWTQEDFNRVIEIIDGMGMQCCTHACADGGIRRIVNAYEHAQKVNGKRDSRHRIEHGDLPHPDDIKRMGELGVYVAQQPCHFYGEDLTVAALGEERIQRIHPWQSYVDAGVNLSFGSDWCTAPYNPVYGLLIAGTRMNYTGKANWGPDEKIDIETAIEHYTIGSAKALMMEDEIGSIEVGKFGDFAIFNTDLLKMTSLWFLLTHKLDLGEMDDFVDMTIVGGEIVYEK